MATLMFSLYIHSALTLTLMHGFLLKVEETFSNGCSSQIGFCDNFVRLLRTAKKPSKNVLEGCQCRMPLQQREEVNQFSAQLGQSASCSLPRTRSSEER